MGRHVLCERMNKIRFGVSLHHILRCVDTLGCLCQDRVSAAAHLIYECQVWGLPCLKVCGIKGKVIRSTSHHNNLQRQTLNESFGPPDKL